MSVPDSISQLRPPVMPRVGPDVWAFARETAPEPGDVCVAEFMDRDRDAVLALVLDVDLVQDERAVPVALVSADSHLATDNDVLVERDQCGMPYDVMVRTDLVAPLFVVQLGAVVGRLDPETLSLIKGAGLAGPSAIPIGRRGPRLSAYSDDRLPAKEADAALLLDLASECLDEILEPQLTLLAPEGVTAVPELITMALERGALIADEALAAAPDELAELGLGDVYLDATATMIEAFATSGLGPPSPEPTSIHPEHGAASAVPGGDALAGVIRLGRSSVSFLVPSPKGAHSHVFARIASETQTTNVQAVIEYV
jgi:hypothetical protein